MVFLMLAGERCRPAALEIVPEPTGWPVSRYESTMKRKICRERSFNSVIITLVYVAVKGLTIRFEELECAASFYKNKKKG